MYVNINSVKRPKCELVVRIWKRSKTSELFLKNISFWTIVTPSTGTTHYNIYLLNDNKFINNWFHFIYDSNWNVLLLNNFSTVGLAQQWDQLDQLGMRMQHNLEQQIQARNQSGVSEDALKEFSMMFK